MEDEPNKTNPVIETAQEFLKTQENLSGDFGGACEIDHNGYDGIVRLLIAEVERLDRPPREITREERLVLLSYTGYLGRLSADSPEQAMSPEYLHHWIDVLDQFEEYFNKNAELMRKPKTAEVIARLAERRGVTEEEMNRLPARPVEACELKPWPHDHKSCVSVSDGEVEH